MLYRDQLQLGFGSDLVTAQALWLDTVVVTTMTIRLANLMNLLHLAMGKIS